MRLSSQMSGNFTLLYSPVMETRASPEGYCVPLPVTVICLSKHE